jgi:hypothetical protein
MKQEKIMYLERKIAIGFIISTEFVKIALPIIELPWVQSKEAKIIISWCIEFYKKYNKAPGSDIHDIYMQKIREKNIPEKNAAFIEEILDDLSLESEKEELNIEYLSDQLVQYSKACKMLGYAEQIQDEVHNGNIQEAEKMLTSYVPPSTLKSNGVTPLGELEQIKDAFLSVSEPVIKLPGDLGDMLNHTLTRDSFVALLGQNKSGKSFMLMYFALRAARQRKKVLFIQCGDMSQAQMERRFGIYFGGKSDLSKYCNEMLVPVIDCVHNLTGKCTLNHREGGADAPGPLSQYNKKALRKSYDFPFKEYIKAFNDYPEHEPCTVCKKDKDLYKNYLGCIWYTKREQVKPLTWKDVYKLNKKFSKILNNIKLVTYPSDRLSISNIYSECEILERQGFMADVIIVDYMDLMSTERYDRDLPQREKINKIWQGARTLSQEKRTLFITATQSDTAGFTKISLNKENFSDSRTKLDHVTAMFGLNSTKEERLKGVMRINDIAGRETEGTNIVHVTHRLQLGRPVLGSFY